MSRDIMVLRGGTMVLIGCVALVACQKSLPTAPSELLTGVTVYEHANYGGQSAHVTQDIKNLKDFKGPCRRYVPGSPGLFGTWGGPDETKQEWDDCISSIRVAPGWGAILYEDDDFKGDRLEIQEDHSNLQLATGRCNKGGFNDCASSIRVLRP